VIICTKEEGIQMIIIRYSIHKFEPQYQSHHLEDVDYHLNNFDINAYPKHLQYSIQKQHEIQIKFYQENYEDFKWGIWAFIKGCKYSQSLNHLKTKVPCWRAEISDDTIVYDVNWEHKMKITDNKCKLFGFYIPESQLNTCRLLI
jgi:hypothetical protein